MTQTRLTQWITITLLLLLMGTSWSCKRRKNVDNSNNPGSVLVLRPATEKERIVRKTFMLKLKLFDTEGIQSIKVYLQNQKLWEKFFPPNKFTELIVERKINLRGLKLKDGKHPLLFKLTDQKGNQIRSKFSIFLDRLGPSISWIEPQPGQQVLQLTRALVKVTDVGAVSAVKILHDNKVIKSFLNGGPYQFTLDPSEFPAGNVTFWVQATDELGNNSAKSFSFQFVGAALGQSCSFSDGCKAPSVCVKRKGAKRGFCRRKCRRNYDCPAGFRCRRVEKVKFCLPPLPTKTKQGKRLAGLFGKCSRQLPCARGMVCIQFPKGGSCRIRCGYGRRCQEGFKCMRVKWTSDKRSVPVCLRPRRRNVRKMQIGQRCKPPQKPCVKEGMCVRAGGGPAKCYQICSSSSDCPSGVECNPVPGKRRKVCANVPKSQRSAGLYEICGRSIPCRSGLFCISSTKNPKPRCFPKCGSSHCNYGSACLPIAGQSLCLSKCVPNEANCPSGTACRFYMINKKGGYYCN